MELRKEHFMAMKHVKDGATIFGRGVAVLLREVASEDPDLINIIESRVLRGMGEDVYNEAGELAYFGAVLTGKGRRALLDYSRGQGIVSSKTCQNCLSFIGADWIYCGICGTKIEVSE